ncbi:ARL14 effector protein [Protobothrops mucrosquamatus]|uniref:ARL14 effector protein n=1 Tax=Protobothrops mucrosquamatus TaxID=103944 RepID=UPI000775BC90|nr:ARL14 effector protein [Protobothrops mucrosquamatus]
MDPCSIGSQLQASSDCHKAYFTSQTGFKTKQDLSATDLLLLQLRTGITLSEAHTICFHHAKVYLDRYEDLQKSCCDPFNMHKKLSRKNLRAIDIDDVSFLSAKFGRQFIPGWKLCPKCTQIISGNAEVDSEDRQRRRLDSDGRTTKALKSLQFANPGRHTGFAPETNKREKRKLQTKNTSVNSDRQLIAAKSKVYDSQGFLLYSGIDLCDCLDEDCLGCFYACSKCGSRKCGPECRCDRKWLYEQIEIEGGEIIRNKHAI